MASGPHTPAGTRRRERRGGSLRRAAAATGAPRAGASAAREPRSDLSARVLAAMPAIAVALFLVIEGGLVFALGLFVLGCSACTSCTAMYERAHPVRLAGFLALAGLLAGGAVRRPVPGAARRRRRAAAAVRADAAAAAPERRRRWR